MTETTDESAEERFDLQQMLQEVQEEASQDAQGPLGQADILKMFRDRKPRQRDA